MSSFSAQDGWYVYGPERSIPNNARMYVLTNEQINFIASLVSGTNDVLSLQIPGPFYVDQRKEAIVFHRIDFIMREQFNTSPSALGRFKLAINLQYSDKEPAANWNNDGEDVEDENTQAMFDGPILVGHNNWSAEGDADATLMVVYPDTDMRCCMYYPPAKKGLDAFFPVTVVLVNASADRDLVDQAADVVTFSTFEQFSMRCWFTTRKLTKRERDMMTTDYYGLIPFS